ncbi:MAG: hypothetical protein FWC04_07395 [Chitinispirillia bacterium]|nr:hypothetical protein [Chitinispirillia bacterium]
MYLKRVLVAGMAAMALMAGAVDAQTPNPAASMLDSVDVLNGRSGTSGAMTVSYNLSGVASLTVTPLTPTRTALNAIAQVGTIRVLCSYTNWDVSLRFTNGGQLKTTPPGSGSTPVTPGVTPPSLGSALRNVSGDSVIILVMVGIQQQSGGTVGTVVLKSTDITKAVDVNNAISMAKAIGGTAPFSTNTFTPNNTATGRTGNQIATSGFPATTETAADAVVFFVNAGLNYTGTPPAGTPLTPSNTPSGNPDGVYTETITATLLASF